MKSRRADHDVTDSVLVASTQPVRDTVREIFLNCYPNGNFSYVDRAFEDFEKLFEGEFRGFQACDTFYHDKQHTLDMTLALSRLIEGYERICKPGESFGAIRASIGLITALFHDSGYIRSEEDEHENGAVYTKIHVTRSADFLKFYLDMIGLQEHIDIAMNMVHYTGYELAPELIKLPEKRLHILGHMMGTADLIAQMSDRCYLEKCRDRLFPEFVIGGIAVQHQPDGTDKVIYSSGDDLLNKTPDFYKTEIVHRLNGLFNKVYRYAEKHFGDKNYYMEALELNLQYLQELINTDSLTQLTRIPLTNRGIKRASTTNTQQVAQLHIR